jgi:hypothetical protein
MPLTPRFSIKQTPNIITLIINIPHVKISNIEFLIQNNHEITLSVRPYLLKLKLPGLVKEEDEDIKMKYNPDESHGTLYIDLIKLNPGEYFENLNMITSLLQHTKSSTSKTTDNIFPVEVVGVVVGNDNDAQEFENGFGFGRGYPNLFGCTTIDTIQQFLEEYPQLSELRFVDSINLTNEQRHLQREQDENNDFSIERFKLDTFSEDVAEDSIYQQAIQFISPHKKIIINNQQPLSSFTTFILNQEQNLKKDIIKNEQEEINSLIIKLQNTTVTTTTAIFTFGESNTTNNSDNNTTKPNNNNNNKELDVNLFFTTDEQDQLSRLRNKSFNWITSDKETFLSIIDILLAYSHEFRMTDGEFNVESALTIRKLSATLSYSIYYKDFNELFRIFSRRALSYSYLRRWDLICLSVSDTECILGNNKIPAIRSLLRVKKLFSQSNTMYLLNRIFMDDMLIWIQQLQEQRFKQLIDEYKSTASLIFVYGARCPTSAFVGWKLLGSSVAPTIKSQDDDDDVFEGID